MYVFLCVRERDNILLVCERVYVFCNNEQSAVCRECVHVSVRESVSVVSSISHICSPVFPDRAGNIFLSH